MNRGSRRSRGAPPTHRWHQPMIQYIIRRLLWVIVLLYRSDRDHVRASSTCCRPPIRRCCARGATRSPELIHEIAHSLGIDKPLYTQYWRVHEAARPALRPRLQLLQRRRPVKSLIFDRLPATISLDRRRRRHLAADRHPDRDHLGGQAPHLLDRASMSTALVLRSPRRSTGSGSSALYLFADGHRQVPDLVPARGGQLHRDCTSEPDRRGSSR